MGNFRHVLRVWFATGTLIALSACGGGGGGGSPPPSNPGNPPPAGNSAPTVTVGDDQTIQLPTNSVTVTANASDPEGTTPTISWASAPSDGVTFDDEAAASTTVTFTDAGTYTLTATASDGSLSASDALVVTVTAASGGGEPGSPVVSAGDDQTIEYPMSATLSGAATDDSTELTYAWTSDVDGVTFADAAAAATTASFPAPGTYELTLTASDGTSSGSDVLQVTVGEPHYPAADTDADEQYGWTFASAADVGMDDTLLDQARDYALTGGGAGLIVRHGRVVKAWGNIDSRVDVKSTTKSIGGIALGLAIDDSLILPELNELAVDKLPGFGMPPAENASEGIEQITLLQLATHTAGFEKDGGFGDIIYAPGTTWHYSDGGLNWLADVLTHVYQQDLEQLLVARVWNHLGVREGDDVEWRSYTSGQRSAAVYPDNIERRELASGITINTQTMARVGLLFLRDGKWGGTQVVSASFDDLVRTPRSESASATNPNTTEFPTAPQDYGVLWWTNTSGALANVPTDAYWAWGLGDSLIVVIPSLDLVIARTGSDPDELPGSVPEWRLDWNGDYTVLEPFLDPIVQSVQQ